MLQSESIKRVVVRGTNWAGDAIMTIPALRQLRQTLPKAHLTLATRPTTAELFADAEFIDDLLVGNEAGTLSAVRSWSGRGFDLAILLTNSFQSALVSFLARVPNRLGYATQHRKLMLTDPVPLPSWCVSRHEVYYYLNLIAELKSLLNREAQPARELNPHLTISLQRRTDARALLTNNGVAVTDTLVALCPGSINSRAKRWPAERFAQVADQLSEQSGVKILLVGSAEELPISLEVKNRMRHNPVLLTGQTTLGAAAAVLSHVDLLITNDTGPAHIASALGRPTLVIFGPTNPLTTSPFADAEIVRKPPDCAPCMLRDCPIDHRCMTAITSAEVVERAITVLGRSKAQSLAEKQAVGVSEVGAAHP